MDAKRLVASTAAALAGVVMTAFALPGIASADLAAPKGFGAARTASDSGTILISWKAVDGADHYVVDLITNGVDAPVDVPLGTTSYSVDASNACSAFKMRVGAADADGTVSYTSYTSVRSLTPGYVQGMRTGRTDAGKTGTATWRTPVWPGYTAITDYHVVFTRLVDKKVLVDTRSMDTSFTYPAIDPARAYTISVAAENSYGVCYTAKSLMDRYRPADPNTLVATRSSTSTGTATLSWKQPNVAPTPAYYMVQYGLLKATTSVRVDWPATSIALPLDPAKAWVVSVKAYNENGSSGTLNGTVPIWVPDVTPVTDPISGVVTDPTPTTSPSTDNGDDDPDSGDTGDTGDAGDPGTVTVPVPIPTPSTGGTTTVSTPVVTVPTEVPAPTSLPSPSVPVTVAPVVTPTATPTTATPTTATPTTAAPTPQVTAAPVVTVPTTIPTVVPTTAVPTVAATTAPATTTPATTAPATTTPVTTPATTAPATTAPVTTPATTAPVTTPATTAPATTAPVVVVDKTPPTITATVADMPVSGWLTKASTIHFTCSDTGSGMAACPADVAVTADGANQTFSGTATDKAGNTSTASITVNVDKTAPTITATIAGTPSLTGWYRSAVTIHYTCTDTASTVALCPADVAVTADGANQTFTGTATDVAGNTATTGTTVNLDRGVPQVSVAGATDGTVYNPKTIPTPSCATTDPVSGVATKAAMVVTRTQQGVHTVVCSGATDKAGNSGATVTARYQVKPTIDWLTGLTHDYMPKASAGTLKTMDDALANRRFAPYITRVLLECLLNRTGATPAQVGELIYWGAVLATQS